MCWYFKADMLTICSKIYKGVKVRLFIEMIMIIHLMVTICRVRSQTPVDPVCLPQEENMAQGMDREDQNWDSNHLYWRKYSQKRNW